MDDTLQSALGSAFPDRTVGSVSEPPESNHHGNRTARVTFDEGDPGVAYLKVRTDGDRERNAREAAATRYARRHAAVRTPRVLAADADDDPPYLATAPLAGTPASDPWPDVRPEQRERLTRAVGRATAGVAAARFERPGWIRGGDADDLALDTGSWSEVLADAVVRRNAADPYPDRFADVPDRVSSLVHDRADRLDGAETALVHRDARPANVLLGEGDRPLADDGSLGVLDWESSIVGDPGLGLCRAEEAIVERAEVPAPGRDRLRAAIEAGYRDVAGGLPAGYDRRRPVYRVVTFQTTLVTFDLWAPGAAEPVEDLAAWARGELDDRIAAVE